MKNTNCNFIDTHCHLDWVQKKLKLSLDDIISECQNEKNNLEFLIQSIDDFQSNFFAFEIAKKYENFVFAMTGIHPQHAHEKHDISELEKILKHENEKKENKKNIVAIGEIGIDLHYPKMKKTLKTQEIVFFKMLELAKKYDFPVSIHSWDSFDETFSILSEFKKNHFQDLKIVIHSFSYDPEKAKKFLDLDCVLSFTGSLTYKKNEYLRETVKFIPKNRIFAETDAPFMPPDGYRGKPNKPFLVKEVYKKISQIWQKDISETCKIIRKNIKNFYEI